MNVSTIEHAARHTNSLSRTQYIFSCVARCRLPFVPSALLCSALLCCVQSVLRRFTFFLFTSSSISFLFFRSFRYFCYFCFSVFLADAKCQVCVCCAVLCTRSRALRGKLLYFLQSFCTHFRLSGRARSLARVRVCICL